jgi:serine/threonine protein kinase
MKLADVIRRAADRVLPGRVARAPAACDGFGPYRLVEQIGCGGMAEVHSAVRDDRPLVVKRLRPELAADPVAVRYFLDEGTLASALDHPNIVRVFEHGSIGGQHYITAEYVAGRDAGCLTRKMVAGKLRPLSATAILYLAHEITAALEYAHACGLVHGDITPENILVSRTGEVKLLDFGIAQNGHGRREVVAGNVDFMSPEQARGQPTDGRSDLFSLGLVLYFCAARAPLYRSRSVEEALPHAMVGPSPRDLEFVSGLAPPLPELLPRLLAVDPALRFDSARDLGETVAGMLGTQTTAARAELCVSLERLFGPALDDEEQRLWAATGRSRTGIFPAL